MTAYRLSVQDLGDRTLGPEAPALTVGRSPDNDWVLDDTSISRRHARFEWDGDGLSVRDLGSKNGTSLNGAALLEPARVRPGDQLILGNVLVAIGFADQPLAQGPPPVRLDGPPAAELGLAAFSLPAAKVRSGEGLEGGPWAQVLGFIHELTLGLIRETTPRALLEQLVERLLQHLQADRGALLLKDAQGSLEPEVVRVRGNRRPEIRLSRTLVEAVLERREAILLTGPMDDPLASRSLILSGVTTVIATPLEAEGQVIGLLYFDSFSLLRQFTRDDLQLAATLAHVAAAKLQSAKLMAEAQRTRTLEHEMAIAREIQLRMLPLASPVRGPFDLYAELRPAREVGGDLYDYHWRDGRLCFCIGDVSGKGVPAALVMALTKTLFRANGSFLDDPGRLMAAVNERIYEETGPAIFVSAFCGFFDPADGRIAFSNAGHEAPVILSPSRPARFLEVAHGLALGILPDYAYQAQETVLGDREALLLYTDGITEANDPARELYTPERMMAELERRPGEDPLAVVAHLLGAVERFAAGAPQADDLTLLCLRRRRDSAEAPLRP